MIPISVTHFQRKPVNQQSIERYFKDVRKHLPVNIKVNIYTAWFKSKGIHKLILNIIFGALNQNQINHITGDIYYIALLMNPGRTVITYHDCVSLERLKGLKKWILYLFWYWIPFHRANKITAVSKFTKYELVKYLGCDSSKIQVIYDSLFEGFKKTPKKFNSQNPIILFIGTALHKNLMNTIMALEGIPCQLRIIGVLGKLEKNLLISKKLEYSNSENLSDEEIILEYQKCDLLVFASLYEGFGLPIIEANAIGRPVVSSNLCSMPEVAGKAACLVDPTDIQDIRYGVLKIIRNASYRNQLVQNGYQNIKRFDSKKIATQYASLYEAIGTRSRTHENIGDL